MTKYGHTQPQEAGLEKLIDATEDPPEVRLDDIHGLSDIVTRVREAFIPVITSPHAEVRSPCVLIHGPNGIGKTRIAQAIAGELGMHEFRYLHYPPISGDQARNNHHNPPSEEAAAKVLDISREAAPITLLIENFQLLHARKGGHFQTAVNDIREAAERIAIICINSDDSRHLTRLQQEGWYDFADFQLHVPRPDEERQAYVLEKMLRNLTSDTEISLAADVTASLSGMTDFDMKHIHDAGRRAVVLAQSQSPYPPTVTADHVSDAIVQINTEISRRKPRGNNTSDSRFTPTVPDVTFDDIGGLSDVVERVKELVTYPELYAELYANSNLESTGGILLHGPPGTGKTMLAKALATETDRAFLAVEGAEIKSWWYGGSEKHIRELFREAREAAPSIIFFDEIDALAGRRGDATHSTTRSIVNTLLAELDGIGSNNDLLVIAATNRLEAIDPAIRRPGRIGELIEVPTPDRGGIKEIFDIQTKGLPLHHSVTPAWFITTIPDGLTGADIAGVVERGLHLAIRRSDTHPNRPIITRSHLESAIASHGESGTNIVRGFE